MSTEVWIERVPILQRGIIGTWRTRYRGMRKAGTNPIKAIWVATTSRRI